MTATPPPPPPTESAKLKKEIGSFLIVLGVILAAVGFWSYSALKGNPHDLFGVSRNVALGVPLMSIGLLHLVSGGLLIATSNRVWAILGAVAPTLMAIFFFTFFIAATGRVPLNLISVLVVVIPAGVWVRTRVYLRALAPQ